MRGTDYLLAIATSSGFQLEWLTSEVKERRGIKKPLLIIADKGIKIPQRVPHIWIDRANPAKTISKSCKAITKFTKDEEIQKTLLWMVTGGVLFLLLHGRERGHSCQSEHPQ